MSARADLRDRVIRIFQERHGGAPAFVVRAPGRVNLIGEHTDYNDGFVMPMAIDRATWMAVRPRADGIVQVYSIDFDGTARFALADLPPHPPGGAGEGWIEYIKGMAWALRSAGYDLRGMDAVVSGDVPIGAGLSSSAAIEMAAARALAAVSDLPWDAAVMARLGQQAENQWVGVSSGIMDQMISAAGQAGRALLIDCRSLETTPAPLPPGTVVVILDTATRRELVTSAYNERRQQCEAAARHFGVPALRDLTLEQLLAAEAELDPTVFRRARHVVTENTRTLEALAAMQAGDAARLGELMNASHASLRDDFAVTNDALDIIAAIAQGAPGAFGARMTGAGFGGCAVALVAADRAEAFTAQVAAAYQQQTGLMPTVYVTLAADGAQIVA
jgi:galactokinase